MYEGSSFSEASPALIICLFDYSHSSGCEVVSVYSLIYIFFMATDTEHLLMSLLAICIYSLEISKEQILMVILTGTTNMQGPGQLKFFAHLTC